MTELQDVPISRFERQVCYRIIPTKYPPIHLFEDVADADEFDALYAVQALTNPRLLDEVGAIEQVPRHERPFGIPGCSWAMSPFTHVNRDGSRFSNGDFGIYYAAEFPRTAIRETVHHMQKWLGYTRPEPQDLDMRCLAARFDATMLDIRGDFFRTGDLYHPDDYTASRRMGHQVKRSLQHGIVYGSVRDQHRACYALFTPKCISEVIQSAIYTYRWDGGRINTLFEKREIQFED